MSAEVVNLAMERAAAPYRRNADSLERFARGVEMAGLDFRLLRCIAADLAERYPTRRPSPDFWDRVYRAIFEA